jgi:serine protease Do
MSRIFARRNGRWLALGLAALGLVLTGPIDAAQVPLSAARNAPIVPPGPPGAKPAPASFADLADQLSETVVNISTTQVLRRRADPDQGDLPNLPQGSPLDDFFKDFLDRGGAAPRRVTSLGSGFIIDPAGFIVTNNHVIEDADEISVILNDGTTLPATLVGTDEKTDLALLRVKPNKPLPSTRFGDSDKARVGDWVIAIGNPFGLENTVTAGIVSARGRNINAGEYDDFLQTDATINPGNSGGPLFNMAGEVIGINTAIYSRTGGSVGIGFSIPSNEAKFVISQLKATGKVARGMIGVRIQKISDEIAAGMGLSTTKGALVSGVTDGQPAAKAGIRSGDVIVSFDGKDVPDDQALPRIVADTAIGKKVPVEIIRQGQKRTVSVQVARLEEAAPKPAPKAPANVAAKPGKQLSSRLGLTMEAISPDTRARYQLKAGIAGVVVTDVDPAGPASDKNLRPGDVIVEVAQQKVNSPAEVEAKVEAEAKAGHTAVLLLVNRDGQQSYVGLKIGK